MYIIIVGMINIQNKINIPNNINDHEIGLTFNDNKYR